MAPEPQPHPPRANELNTMMSLLLCGLAVLILGALLSAIVPRGVWPKRLGPVLAVTGSVLIGSAGVWSLRQGVTVVEWTVPFFRLPIGGMRLGLDPLSGFFLLLIAVIGSAGAVYGAGYLASNTRPVRIAWSWTWYLLLLAAMSLVAVARDGILFLIAWEGMSISSFFLVLFEHERHDVREAGWIYIIAAHFGAVCLLAMFALLGNLSGSFSFDGFGRGLTPVLASAVFLLALLGFGSKAGIMPLHVWLPEAHPAAPSHVSALMSGVMIKMGVYGLLRVLTFTGTPPQWWAWLLIGIGAITGVLGVLFALAQHDLKRLLAYSSVENIGIVILAIGLGLLGWNLGNPTLAVLGFAGGLFHVFNHAIFKSLLFFGAGAVQHEAHTRDMDRMGGLLCRMPATGALFILGSAAIAGLPPLNGFAGEFLVYLAAFNPLTLANMAEPVRLACIVAIASLALIGGLAGACFVKAAGSVFLGEARHEGATHAKDAGLAMTLPMGLLGFICLLAGLGAPVAVSVLMPVLDAFPLSRMPNTIEAMRAGVTSLTCIGMGGGMLLVIIAVLLLLRRALLRGKPVDVSGTWDCGYVAPTARMQYTSSSFAGPIMEFFHPVLRTKTDLHAPDGIFPRRAVLHTHTTDNFRACLFEPAFNLVRRTAMRLCRFQQGQIQVYVLYLAVTLIVLLAWKLR